ncbi:MAG: serine/threonine protein kinase [Anaerolineales bacterium]|nr:serine/threonine protein kinase [Anaerolineales bacterium]
MMEGAVLNNRYKLLERFGSGGMAIVYRARDLMLERDVAIKLLRENYSDNTSFQSRFRQEARAAANLSHPNIVTVHDFGLEKGLLYLVMEYVPGTDLKTMIKQRGRFSIPEAIPLIVQACAGIGYAHRAGLVHCDIKPQNMLVTPDQRLKVTDFGIARALSTIHPDEHNDVVWGSPQYFSPEQAAGEAPSPASDVYSLGVVLYEMLTGSLPFIATTVEALSHMHRNTEPVPIHEYLPDIPPALEQIAMKVLSKEPSARYRTADQLGRVLLKFGTESDVPSPLSLTPEASTAYQAAVQAPSRPTTRAKREPVSHPIPYSNAAILPAFVESENIDANIDWISVGLGLIALIAVFGLVPFWIWVIIRLYPPIQ